ncbi:hypothetical protein ASG42_28475 [Rhizobium sp. Leaf391]|uniref:hypothetical protein n=1 Tax=Rhizobium sp. Leaf391 TaxID=1736360 RepID=UPI0007142AD3|nr:hypothetical protein [Rhizobium sp. Leaf391]KQS96825.1 hypothetical protein ASG42_28475 [Rhizobium sp. Leaf391]
MNKTLTLALAATLSALPVAATSVFAQTATATAPMMADDMVTIVNVEQSGTDNDNSQKQIPAQFQSATPAAMKMAQDELSKDMALVAVLQKKNVTLTNVVGVQTAANGGKIVYVK